MKTPHKNLIVLIKSRKQKRLNNNQLSNKKLNHQHCNEIVGVTI